MGRDSVNFGGIRKYAILHITVDKNKNLFYNIISYL